MERRLALSSYVALQGPSYIAKGASSCSLHVRPVFIYPLVVDSIYTEP